MPGQSPLMTWIGMRRRTTKVLNIGWFATGRGPGSQGLLRFVQDRILQGKLDARIQFVFSNRQPGEAEGSDEFFRLVDGYGIPLVTLSSAEFRRARGGRFAALRDEFDREALAQVGRYAPDICILAGYMLILGGEMCRRYPFLNLHPALPDGPIGTWQEVIWELIQTRADRTGAMIHLATEQVDRGPVVSYCTVPLRGDCFDPLWDDLEQVDLPSVKAEQGDDHPLFRAIRAAEYRREPYLLLETLRAADDGQLPTAPDALLQPDVESPSGSYPRCLDLEIDRAMRDDGLL